MKIAVATEGKMVSEHFGHCESFTIYEINENTIQKEEVIQNPGHKKGFLPHYLHERGVNVIISGGMGGGATEIFIEKGIAVITGATGDAKENVLAYVAGTLKSTGSICHEHQHAGECGE